MSSRSSRSSQAIGAGSTLAWEKYWHDESERLKSPCEVSMWTRPLDSTKKEETGEIAEESQQLSSILESSAAFSKYIAALAPFSHWALIFSWHQNVQDEDGDVIFPRTACYEGFNDGGKLIPNWSKLAPEGVDWTKKHLGDIIISPKEVNKHAKELWCNNRVYKVVLFNCQLWVRALWKKIKGEDIPVAGMALVAGTAVTERRLLENNN